MAHLAYNERMKYRATWLNTISAGMLLVGFVTPLASGFNPAQDDYIGEVLRQTAKAEAVTAGIFWMIVSVVLHLLAINIVGRVRE